MAQEQAKRDREALLRLMKKKDEDAPPKKKEPLPKGTGPGTDYSLGVRQILLTPEGKILNLSAEEYDRRVMAQRRDIHLPSPDPRSSAPDNPRKYLHDYKRRNPGHDATADIEIAFDRRDINLPLEKKKKKN